MGIHIQSGQMQTIGETVRAPLRWAGSKRKSLAALTQYLPSSISHYVEPFAGSASLAFLLQPPEIVIGDVNPKLIEFYNFLKAKPTQLHQIYSAIEASPNTYYQSRETYNNLGPSIERAGLFLYLNRHCFNGIYRVNKKGGFNVPWGGDKVGKPLTHADLLKASAALKGADLICGDFEQVIRSSIRAGSVVYLDPPYATNESRVFREYHEDSFATHDWKRLLDTLAYIDESNAYFLLSYAGDTALIDDLGRWNAGFLDVTRNVGGFRESRRKHREFLATNIEWLRRIG